MLYSLFQKLRCEIHYISLQSVADVHHALVNQAELFQYKVKTQAKRPEINLYK